MAEILDLRGVPCPANTARAVLRLETMADGDVLTLLLDDGEPVANVPPAVVEEGHAIIERAREAGGWRLAVRRGG